MAKIKGWKILKNTDEVFRFYNIPSKSYIFGGKYHSSKKWLLAFASKNKTFSNKSKALTFAKQWMKKHPNG